MQIKKFMQKNNSNVQCIFFNGMKKLIQNDKGCVLMKINQYKLLFATILLVFSFFPLTIYAEDEKQTKKNKYAMPKHVFSITKENTYKNTLEDQSSIEPSELTKELIDGSSIEITNQNFIKQLNETAISPSPISFGYRGMVYLGRWALDYESTETTVNWEYQQINTNELNNVGGNRDELLQYVQQGDREVLGVLTSKISEPDDVRQMILSTVKQKTRLPVSFRTKIGNNTKKENKYNVPVQKYGYLNGYVPAVHEQGKIIFGEAYIQLKGSKKSLVIKNVTKQEIGAWMPLHDHISLHVHMK